MSRITHVTADGDVTTTTTFVHSAVLTAGSDAATVVLKEGGSGGTTLVTLKAAASTTVAWTAGDSDGAQFTGGVYADVTGTAPAVAVEHR